MSDKIRGIVEIDVDGDAYFAKFSMSAIKEVEELTGSNFYKHLAAIESLEAPMSDIGDVFFSAISCGERYRAKKLMVKARELDKSDILDAMDAADFKYYSLKIAEAFRLANNGGIEDNVPLEGKKEDKQEKETEK